MILDPSHSIALWYFLTIDLDRMRGLTKAQQATLSALVQDGISESSI
jgi:hypothetical protein